MSGRDVIKVFLVNGESRTVRLEERMDVAVGLRRACPALSSSIELLC